MFAGLDHFFIETPRPPVRPVTVRLMTVAYLTDSLPGDFIAPPVAHTEAQPRPPIGLPIEGEPLPVPNTPPHIPEHPAPVTASDTPIDTPLIGTIGDDELGPLVDIPMEHVTHSPPLIEVDVGEWNPPVDVPLEPMTRSPPQTGDDDQSTAGLEDPDDGMLFTPQVGFIDDYQLSSHEDDVEDVASPTEGAGVAGAPMGRTGDPGIAGAGVATSYRLSGLFVGVVVCLLNRFI